MNTKLSEFRTELNNRIAAAKVSGFWTEAMKDGWINKSGERVCNFKKWKDLELAVYTAAGDEQEYYDYPAEFKPNSIYYLEVDGDPYGKRTWEEYQAAKEAESTDKIFTSHNGYYFISPTPEESVEITIWGNKRWVKLVGEDDESIMASEFDEPIIKLALATCLQKERRYSEANSEISEVEAPKNPNVEGSGGILAKIAAREEEEEPKGFVGTATSSRFTM